MFNNCDSETNGELLYYDSIKDRIDIIFDVGCRTDTLFYTFKGTVHYFDPMDDYITVLKNRFREIKPQGDYILNSVGLGDEKAIIPYYKTYESFYNRSITLGGNVNKDDVIFLNIVRGDEYIKSVGLENTRLGFLKIDTEGYEYRVMKGFGKYIQNFDFIQFEYGGTYKDNGITLRQVIDYLSSQNFHNFRYLTTDGTCTIDDFNDHYQYCNIVCENKNIIC